MPAKIYGLGEAAKKIGRTPTSLSEYARRHNLGHRYQNHVWFTELELQIAEKTIQKREKLLGMSATVQRFKKGKITGKYYTPYRPFNHEVKPQQNDKD